MMTDREKLQAIYDLASARLAEASLVDAMARHDLQEISKLADSGEGIAPLLLANGQV